MPSHPELKNYKTLPKTQITAFVKGKNPAFALTDDFKIIGSSESQFEQACKKYLWANKNLIKRTKDEQNLSSDEQAISFFIQDRKSLYLK